MPLSREHHFDLLLAWKLRKGISYEIEPARMAAYIQYLDENMMHAHFDDEEKELFALMPEDKKIIRAMNEHDEIRELITQIVVEKDDRVTTFNQLADRVEAHVRFEERELFPYLEEKLSSDLLENIESAIHKKHQGFQEVWEDAFWVFSTTIQATPQIPQTKKK